MLQAHQRLATYPIGTDLLGWLSALPQPFPIATDLPDDCRTRGHQICSAFFAQVLWVFALLGDVPSALLLPSAEQLLSPLPDSEKAQPAPTTTSLLMQDKSCSNISAFALLQS